MTNCGKTKLILDLLENNYRHHFEYIIIICPSLAWNVTYHDRPWIWSDENIYIAIPGKHLYEIIDKFSKELANRETLFILDDIIADTTLDKKRQPLLDLASCGRHRLHSLWILTQSYTAISKNIRKQCKMIITFFPNHRSDIEILNNETNLIDDWSAIINELRNS